MEAGCSTSSAWTAADGLVSQVLTPQASRRLPFTHVRAWAVMDCIRMPKDELSVVLSATVDGTYSLEQDITEAMQFVDRGQAIGRAMLAGGLLGQSQGTSKEERLQASLAALHDERNRQIGTFPVLFFVGHGEVDVRFDSPLHEDDDEVVTFDAFDKGSVRQQFEHGHRAMQLALALESGDRMRFREVGGGTYCTMPSGKPFHSISFHMGAEGSVSRSFMPGSVPSIARRFAMLNSQSELASTVRLFADMAAFGREPFRAFVSGWTALEILVKKSFKEYESEFYEGLTFPHQPELAQQFLERARASLGKSLNVRDQFLAMSAVLLPQQSTADAQADLDAFLAIKKQRDNIAHGGEFDEPRLPLAELNRLLMKYLAAHADRTRLKPLSSGLNLSP